QIDLNNLFHFLALRLDWHAQYEIRAYGDAIARIARAVAPVAYDAFEEHILHGGSFSRTELELLRASVDRERLQEALAASGLRRTRQREFLEKLGVELPAAASTAGTKPEGNAGPEGGAGHEEGAGQADGAVKVDASG